MSNLDPSVLIQNDPQMRDAYAVFQALRSLGFPSTSIYVGADDELAFAGAVHAGHSYFLTLGPHGGDFAERWTCVADGIMDGRVSADMLSRAWDASPLSNKRLRFIMELVDNGLLVASTSTTGLPIFVPSPVSDSTLN